MSLSTLVHQLRQLAADGDRALGELDGGNAAAAGPFAAPHSTTAEDGSPAPVARNAAERFEDGPAPSLGAPLPAAAPSAGTHSPAAAPRPGSSGWILWAGLAAVVVLVIGAVVYFFATRGDPEPKAAVQPARDPEPAQPPLPDALRRRMRPVASREEDEEPEPEPRAPFAAAAAPLAPGRDSAWGSEDEAPPGPSQGEPRRHVHFDDQITEYPIPARRISRRAGSDPSAVSMAAARDEAGGADDFPHSVPQIRIDASQRFEG
jgi:hypothetical protein